MVSVDFNSTSEIQQESNPFYVENKDKYISASQQDYSSKRQLKVLTINRGCCLPTIRKANGRAGEYMGGVCSEDGKFIAGLQRGKSNPGYYGSVSVYECNEKTYMDEDVIFGGVLIGHFGHFLLEGMGRFWYFLQHETSDKKIIFCTVLGWKDWFYEYFDLLGVDRKRILIIKEPTAFRSIIVPEESVHSWFNYTKEYLLPYEIIRSKVMAGPYKKIYLTRTQLNEGSDCIGEEYFEEFYREHGYIVIAPEKYTLKEQISIVKGAKEIACVMGSLAHWGLFADAGTKLTCLNRTRGQLITAQFLINQAKKLDCYFVDSSDNYLFANRAYGPCLLSTNRYWQQYVRARFGDESEKVKNEPLKKYLYDWGDYYAKPANFSKICNRDILDVVAEIYHISSGKELSRNNFRQFHMKKDLLNDVEQYRQKYKDLKRSVCGRPLLIYEAHQSNLGWLKESIEGDVCGEYKTPNQIEAVRVSFEQPGLDVCYSVCDRDGKWSSFESNGNMAGTTGKSLPLHDIKISLKGEGSSGYEIRYRLHSLSKGEWTTWAYDGASTNLGERWNGIIIEVMPKAKA